MHAKDVEATASKLPAQLQLEGMTRVIVHEDASAQRRRVRRDSDCTF